VIASKLNFFKDFSIEFEILGFRGAFCNISESLKT
jgi:hypothetical protein